MIRNAPFAVGEYYHLYSRGVDKRLIFLDEADRRRFVRLLYLCNGSVSLSYRNIKNTSLSELNVGERQVAIGAYCLMPNHFHILIKEIKEGGITIFMRKLLTAYSTYFNKKYERLGSLFGSRFKSSYLNTDEYLKYIFAYIHLNPVKLLDSKWRDKTLDAEITQRFLVSYEFSSYHEYAGNGRSEEGLILSQDQFPEYFVNRAEFENHLLDWVNYKHLEHN